MNRIGSEKIAITVGIIFIIIASGIIYIQLTGGKGGSISHEIDFDYRQSAEVGETVEFVNTSEISDDNNWIWDFGDNSPKVQRKDASHVYDEGGRYTVTLTLNREDPASRKQLIVINTPEPVADFSFEDTVRVGDDVSFTNLSLNAHEFIWSFEDEGETNGEESPVYSYQEPGSYQVKLIAVNRLGQIDEQTKGITVLGQPVTRPAVVAHVPVFNENSLSTALTQMANRGTSRAEKRDLKQRIVDDCASIRISVGDMTLENYLNKLQLEASSEQKNIVVSSIKRGANNKIEEITVEN